MTKKVTQTIWISIIILALIGGLVALLMREAQKPGKYDTFAQCLTESGTKFYGAFWCPHCQAQKALFGKSAKLLPYVECSEADGNGQLPVCVDEKIEGYPTWTFADGTRESGEMTLEELAAKTSCTIDPQ